MRQGLAASKEGSAVIMVLGIITLVMMCSMTTWKAAWLTYDLMRMRQQYEQQLRATEGLLAVGIALARDNYQTSTGSFQERTFVYDSWPVGDGRDYQGHVRLQSQLHGQTIKIAVQSSLMHQKERICQMQCYVCAQEVAGAHTTKKVVYTIEEWKIGK